MHSAIDTFVADGGFTNRLKLVEFPFLTIAATF